MSMMSNGRRRSSGSHVQKQYLVGPRAAHVQPAWRSAQREQLSQARRPSGPTTWVQNGPGPSSPPAGAAAGAGGGGNLRRLTPQGGSKILVSNLPDDIVENDIVDLFKARVGKVKDLFVVYRHNGVSRGVAVVHFFEVDSAMKARNMFHGKVVDAELAMRIEIIGEPQSAPPTLSLLSRIGGSSNMNAAPSNRPVPAPVAASHTKSLLARTAPRKAPQHTTTAHIPVARTAAAPVTGGFGGAKGKRKKGPKRLHKQGATVEELDAEMDEWRNGAGGAATTAV